jgi:sporulation protein YlmC with PRC-barrel domain
MRTSDRVDMARLADSGIVLATPDDDVRGMGVVTATGHRLGDVEDLVVDDQHRRARLLVVISGGILGLGVTQRLVPVEAVTKVDDRVHVELATSTSGRDGTRSQSGRPEDHDDFALDEAQAYAEVYSDHGLTPFWGTNYITPYFHRR